MRVCLANLVLALALLSGCRGVLQHATVPNATLPNKYELQADQLLFKSDFVLPADHRLVRELTAERGDLCRTLGLPCANEQIEVYLFHDAAAYSQFLSKHFPGLPSRRAFFLETDTRLTVYAHWSDRVAEDLRHEVAHGYLHSVAPGLPLWLDEGLAEFFEVPRGHGGLNRPHVELLSDMIQLENWQPNLQELEQLSDASQMQQRHYAEAWAWVYYLLNSGPQTRDVLTAYLADVRDNGKAGALSVRLTGRYAAPEATLSEFLVALNEQALATRSSNVTR